MSEFPIPSRLTLLYWGIRGQFSRMTQCKSSHMPWGHLTDEECDEDHYSFFIPRGANKYRYYCQKRFWHLGPHSNPRCCDWPRK